MTTTRSDGLTPAEALVMERYGTASHSMVELLKALEVALSPATIEAIDASLKFGGTLELVLRVTPGTLPQCRLDLVAGDGQRHPLSVFGGDRTTSTVQ